MVILFFRRVSLYWLPWFFVWYQNSSFSSLVCLVLWKYCFSPVYFTSTIIFMVFENFLVIFFNFLTDKTSCFQVFLESKPQNNPYRIKVKPTPTDQALLTTLQTVPGLGQRKAMALLAKFNSKKMNIVILIPFILQQVSGLEKNLNSSFSFGQAAVSFYLAGATSCSS